MKQFLTYIIYTILIYAAIIVLPENGVYAVLCVIVAMMLAMWNYIEMEVV